VFTFRSMLNKCGFIRGSWGIHDAGGNVTVPIGINDCNQIQYLVLGSDAANHALISGRVGSGKSQLMHVVIAAALLSYKPSEIQLYIVDLKEGHEYKHYEEYPLPHIRRVAAGVERDEGNEVLRLVDDELSLRSEIFNRHGIRDFYEYSQTGLPKLPCIILIVDEFQMLFEVDDSVARESTQILERLIRQGRALGIHVLLCLQSLAGLYNMSLSILEQIAIRIAFSSNDIEARYILAEDNPAAVYLTNPGEAIYNAKNGLVEGNNHFQAAYISPEELSYYLEEVRALNK